jgi:hypothetical protein
MNKEFIPYEQALALKELGFDKPCFGWFTDTHLRIGFVKSKHVQGENEILAPLYQQAFRWFREEHGLHHEIKKEKGINDSTNIFFVPITQSGLKKKLTHTPQHTYEEAEFACLIKLIEIVKNNNND